MLPMTLLRKHNVHAVVTNKQLLLCHRWKSRGNTMQQHFTRFQCVTGCKPHTRQYEQMQTLLSLYKQTPCMTTYLHGTNLILSYNLVVTVKIAVSPGGECSTGSLWLPWMPMTFEEKDNTHHVLILLDN